MIARAIQRIPQRRRYADSWYNAEKTRSSFIFFDKKIVIELNGRQHAE